MGCPFDDKSGKPCYNKECRWYVKWKECGNCVLRVKKPHSQVETARILGVSKQRVWAIERRALKKVGEVLLEMMAGG